MRILIDGQTLATPESNRGIGVYFKNVLNSMIENDMSCEWFLNIPSEGCLSQLKSWIRTRVHPIIRQEFDSNHIHKEGYSYENIYTQALYDEIKAKSINVYWNPNPLMNNVLFPTEKLPCKMVVTIHDLIPIVFAEHYLNKWPDPVILEYQSRLKLIGDKVNDIIFDSKSSNIDFKKYVNANKNISSHIVYLGVEKRFKASLFKDKPQTPYILLTGGFDYRKNMEKALQAFALVIKDNKDDEIISSLKFIVVCAYSPDAKTAYEKLADSLGVGNRLIMTGYVNDFELQKLYRECEVFFFPSLYEGFGLPVLEAMSSGVPVVTSNVSSLPEVGSDYAYYCDPENVKDMALTLIKALNNNNERAKRIQEGIAHAQKFTWEITARKTLEVFRKNNNFKVHDNNPRHFVAYVSPMPPQQTGIANYSRLLLPHLAKFFDIDVFTDAKVSQRYGAQNVYPINSLKKAHKNYDAIIYHLGNNSDFHKNIYDLAWERPGIIVLHDYNIHPFLQHAYLLNNSYEMYKHALIEGYGQEGAQHYNDVKLRRAEPDIWRFPASHAIVKKSKSTIVHHHWVRARFKENLPVYVIPHFASPVEIENILERGQNFKQQYDISNNEFLIGIYGFINENKRPKIFLQAISLLRKKGYPVRLVLAGDVSPEVYYINDLVKKYQIQDMVIITGYLNGNEYKDALSAADIVINLRYPSMGEASGTLAESLAYGKATIVSRLNQYMEYPDNVCWKVDVGGNAEIDILVSYLEFLLKNPQVRRCLGHKAQRFAKNVIDIKTISLEYSKVINKVINKK